MKHFLHFIVTFIFAIGILWSCQKEPEFIYSGPSSIDLKADGGSSTLTFSANRNWTVSSSDSWVSVSPSSGAASDSPITISVSCNPNTTYDDRRATVTITMEGFTQVITVQQSADKVILLPTKSYILASGESSFEVEVQANVGYSVSVSVDWIKQISTKGLVSDKLSFSVEENTAVDNREGRIIVKALEGNVSEQIVSVVQSGKDALIVKDSNYDMPYGGGAVEVKVEANVEFDVNTDSEWIHYVQTKAMSTSTVCLSVDENPTYSTREGKVVIGQKGGYLSHTVTIKQAERIAVNSVELNKASLILPLGESETLVATVKPDNASDLDVSWESDHPEVATVNDQGLVTAVSEGTATITAKAINGKSATCIVSAQNIAPRNQIWYTTVSGKPVGVMEDWGGNCVVSNTYENGKGIIVLERGIETVPAYCFQHTDVSSVEIPEGVTSLSYGVFNLCGELVSVSLPNSLRIIGSGAFESCRKLEDINIPDGLKEIGPHAFMSTGIKSFTLPEGVEELPDMVFYECHNLKSVTLHSNLKTIGTRAFEGCESIEKIDLDATVPPTFVIISADTGGYGPFGRPYVNNYYWPVYVPDEAAEDYARAVGWRDYLPWLFTKSGKPLTSFVYKSTDYSKDGEVVLLQKATVGRGVNIVFLGDGFIDKDMDPDGWYEQKMRRGMEVLFCWEPFKTFRDRFNVYTIKCISSSNSYGFPGMERCFSADVAGDKGFVGLQDKGEIVVSMIEKIPNPYNTPINVIVLYNTGISIGRSHAWHREAFGISYCYTIDAIAHEVGHSFGWLADEYITSDSVTDPDRLKIGMDEHHLEGSNTNIDYKSDPSEVLWSHFISDPRYSDEGIGVFQGASSSSTYLYRPTFDSIMRLRGPFNAPSRETIYKHIMQWSEGKTWTYDYEEFVKADAAGHEQWMSHLKPNGSMKEIEYPK
ncbi:MAG: leucine-rich repeat protein [Bacteroidales bacterium]|nr:leucine-rich repeat protein [Bacteroidales bacterium]